MPTAADDYALPDLSPEVLEDLIKLGAGGAAQPVQESPPPPPVSDSVSAPKEAAGPVRDNWVILPDQILVDRPDVLKSFYEAYHGNNNDRDSPAWAERVGAATPEAYATWWYGRYGKYEGYNQGAMTAQDNVSLQRILEERPDVLRGFYEAYYVQNDRNSDAFLKRVGGETPEDYARYWYEKYGRWEGYAQTEKQAAEGINVQQLLDERPDVFRAFFEQYYGEKNDRHSCAWADRVGGETVEDYAKYWYVTHGRAEGYTQHHPAAAQAAPEPELLPEPAADPAPDTDTFAGDEVLLTIGQPLTTDDPLV
ncbi:hypothetical protein [Phenylobacterium deserti]|uniref:Uncharacterized protein n=1 Tax=Phenylobacterium deserti TaxID=1914756 RepID=A0A328A8B4_9CAUL|nr:hypothetical protein [Phenylobacterium deserti]RAK50843.1 hypothetical protein DJ018_16860 [Phenylobacterium deserti]